MNTKLPPENRRVEFTLLFKMLEQYEQADETVVEAEEFDEIANLRQAALEASQPEFTFYTTN